MTIKKLKSIDIINVLSDLVSEKLETTVKLPANCYYNSMKLAMEHGIRKIAFSSISTGVYHFPVEKAAHIALEIVSQFLKEHTNDFDLVEWVLFDSHTQSVYEAELKKFM